MSAIVGSALLGAGGYGVWYAWDNGLVGSNPRAPTPQAMDKAVLMQAAYLAAKRGTRPPCINIEPSSAHPEIGGIPGIGMQPVPGAHSVTMLLQTNRLGQPARDVQLARLGYLAKQGLFSMADTTVTTDDGVERPARTFKLAWDGYAAIRSTYGGSICVNYGRREFGGIEKIEKTLEKLADLEVYEVTYKTVVNDIPPWAATEEARRHFPKLAELIAVGAGKAKVVRTKDGWRSAYELEAEIIVAAKGGNPANLAAMYATGIMTLIDATPKISLEDANKLVAQYLADPDRSNVARIACLPLNLQRGGDEKRTQGTYDATEFAVTYYDKSDRKPYEYQIMARTLHLLAALENAGLAEMEVIGPTPQAPPPRGAGRAPSQWMPGPPRPPGVRYKVRKEAMTAMSMSSYDGGCIPAGRTKYEVLAVLDSPGTVQADLLVRASIDQTPDWVARIAESLPALKAVIDNGLAVRGAAYRQGAGEEAGKWQLSGLNPIYPSPHYEAIPAHLVPLMPLTAASYSATPVMAPALIPDGYAVPDAAAEVPDDASIMPEPAPAAPPEGYQPAPPPPYKPALPPAPRKSFSTPPYPANGSPVHMISIYRAPAPQGSRGLQYHPEGVVMVNVAETNSTLLLFSYEPVEWRIHVAGGAKLKRVVAAGHYDQRVVISGGGRPEVTAGNRGTIYGQSGIDLRPFDIPQKNDANAKVEVARLSRAFTGVLPASFQAAYTAPDGGFSIGVGTPKFALPAPRASGEQAGAVVLRDSHDGKLVDGNRTRRGPAGAYDEVWTEQSYSAGRVYFEGRLRVTGSPAAHEHANIGLCMATDKAIAEMRSRQPLAFLNGEERLYKDGDIVGIAADLDSQVMYYHVNGKWQTGSPGSGSGRRLQKGSEYRACFFPAGTPSRAVARGERQSDTTWEANFGEQKFRAPPAGYQAFRGGAAL
jgi:hypothetical protein